MVSIQQTRPNHLSLHFCTCSWLLVTPCSLWYCLKFTLIASIQSWNPCNTSHFFQLHQNPGKTLISLIINYTAGFYRNPLCSSDAAPSPRRGICQQVNYNLFIWHPTCRIATSKTGIDVQNVVLRVAHRRVFPPNGGWKRLKPLSIFYIRPIFRDAMEAQPIHNVFNKKKLSIQVSSPQWSVNLFFIKKKQETS